MVAGFDVYVPPTKEDNFWDYRIWNSNGNGCIKRFKDIGLCICSRAYKLHLITQIYFFLRTERKAIGPLSHGRSQLKRKKRKATCDSAFLTTLIKVFGLLAVIPITAQRIYIYILKSKFTSFENSYFDPQDFFFFVRYLEIK